MSEMWLILKIAVTVFALGVAAALLYWAIVLAVIIRRSDESRPREGLD